MKTLMSSCQPDSAPCNGQEYHQLLAERAVDGRMPGHDHCSRMYTTRWVKSCASGDPMKDVGRVWGSLTLQIIYLGLVLVHGKVRAGPAAVLVDGCPIKRPSGLLLRVMVAQRGRFAISTDLHEAQPESDRTEAIAKVCRSDIVEPQVLVSTMQLSPGAELTFLNTSRQSFQSIQELAGPELACPARQLGLFTRNRKLLLVVRGQTWALHFPVGRKSVTPRYRLDFPIAAVGNGAQPLSANRCI